MDVYGTFFFTFLYNMTVKKIFIWLVTLKLLMYVMAKLNHYR